MVTSDVVVYISTAMVIGTVGNSIVIYVMGFRYRKSPFNMLIVMLALYDLLSCVMHMPLDIVGIYTPDLLPNSILCKAACSLVAVTVIASSIILAVIAVIRYRGVYKPLDRNINLRHAKCIGVLVLIPALIMSWPIIFMYTNETIETTHMNMTMCGIHGDEYRVPAIGYTSVLLGLFFLNFMCLTVLYIVIARIIIRRKRVFAVSNYRNGSVAIASIMDNNIRTGYGPMSPEIGRSAPNKRNRLLETLKGNSCSSPKVTKVARDETTQKTKTDNKSGVTATLTRNSGNNGLLMMFLVTFLFCISYLPHLGYSLYFLFCDDDEIARLTSQVAFGILVRSYYIHNFANPIIYSICSGEFRAEIVKTVKQLFVRK